MDSNKQVVKNIRDRKEEIDRLILERQRLCRDLVSSVRAGEKTMGNVVEDYLLLVTDASYSEDLVALYQTFVKNLKGYEKQLILIIERSIEDDKILIEEYRLAILRGDHMIFQGRDSRNLYFDTDRLHTMAKFRNQEFKFNRIVGEQLACPDLRRRSEKFSLWDKAKYRGGYRRGSSEIVAIEIIIGNNRVRQYFDRQTALHWNVYVALYRTLRDNTIGMRGDVDNVYRFSA